MVYYISAILHEGDSYIIGCRDKPSVFVLNKTTRTIIQIDYSFRQSIYDIFSFGKNMVATVSAMKDYKDCINIFQINESTPHIHLFSFPSNLGSQETCGTFNSETKMFVSGSNPGILRSYIMSLDRTFTSLAVTRTTGSSSSGISLVKFHPRIPNLLFVVVGNIIFQYKLSDLGEFESLGELHGHPNWINSLEFSRDGTMMVSCSFDLKPTDNIIVWKINGLEPAVLTQNLRGHTMSVQSVAFSHDGTVLASGSLDQTIRIWEKDGDEWICKQVLTEPDSGPLRNCINGVIFDQTDPTLLVSGSSTGRVVFWRLSGGVWMRESVIVL
jgi:WD40 repeat protein